MDRYKNFVKIEELKGLLKNGKNEEALEIAQGIEIKKVKDNWDLMVIGEVYLKNGMLGKARECYSMVYNKKKTRRVAMELVNICIRLKRADEAEKYYEEFRGMAPNDYYNCIFRYKIDRLKGKSLREQAADLEELKCKEFMDTWGYELAKIYHKMGEREKCLSTCEDVIIWFGDGEAVDKAKTLRALYLGEISLKDFNNSIAGGRSNTSNDKESGTKKKVNEVSKDLDIDVVIDYQMEFDHAVDAIVNKDKVETEEETATEAPFDEVVKETEDAEEFTVNIKAEEFEEEKYPSEEASDGGNSEQEEILAEDTAIDEPAVDDNVIDEAAAIEVVAGDTKVITDEVVIVNALVDEVIPEEDVFNGNAETEESNEEEEFTEEELMLGDKDDDDSDIKIAEPKENLPKEEKTTVRHTVHDDFFTDEIAKAVEQALKEDSDEKKQKAENTDPQDMTREWRKPESKSDIKEKAVKIKEDNKLEESSSAKRKPVEEPSETNGSPLLDAVERELGFVGVPEEKEKATTKKSWFERRREKHREKELRKKESERKTIETKEKELSEKQKAAELEKQRFIENEKRKDRQKYLDYKKKMAVMANEKAEAEAEKNQPKAQDASQDDFLVDIKGISPEREKGEMKNGIYTPKRMKCIDIPGNSIVNGYLAGKGRTLEDYFGFFACQRNMSSQILKCLERLLDPEEEVMNYCIIGEKGSGKKAIAHGFARFMADCGKLAVPQTVWTDSNKINSIDLSEKTEKLKGRCLVIDQAGSIDREGIEDIGKVIERLHKRTMIVLADYPRNMVELFKTKEGFEDMFAPRIIIPSFSQEDLFDYVDYKVGTAGFVFDSDAYDLMSKRIKSIMRATEEGALARTEKYLVKTIDNTEQRNGEAYIKQTLTNEKHTRSNVITVECLPESL